MPDLKKFFKKTSVSQPVEQTPEVPKGLWVKCPRWSIRRMWLKITMSVPNAEVISVSRQRQG